MKTKGLTTTQKRAICNILSSKSIVEAARKTKINRKTIYTWLEKSEFKNELEKRKNQLLEGGFTELQLSFTESIHVLRELMKSENESIRLGSAKIIMQTIINVKEIKEIENKLVELEGIINEYKKSFSCIEE
jgi:hypothetical protein